MTSLIAGNSNTTNGSVSKGADAASLEQAVKLLRHAHAASSTAERAAYVGRAQALLKDLVARGVIVLPPRVMGTIEASARKQIEGPRGASDA